MSDDSDANREEQDNQSQPQSQASRITIRSDYKYHEPYALQVMKAILKWKLDSGQMLEECGSGDLIKVSSPSAQIHQKVSSVFPSVQRYFRETV